MFLRAVVTRTAAEADAASLPVLGSCASRLVRAPAWFDVPAEQRPMIERVAAAHDYRRHGTAEARPDVAGCHEADALVRERFVVTGDERRISRHLTAVSGLGIDGVVLAGALTGVVERLDALALASAVRAGLTGSRTRSTVDPRLME